MSHTNYRELLGDAELPVGLVELFDELERCGWHARSRIGQHGVRFWPDDQRGRQIVVAINFALNEHKLEEYRRHTGLELNVKVKEGGK